MVTNATIYEVYARSFFGKLKFRYYKIIIERAKSEQCVKARSYKLTRLDDKTVLTYRESAPVTIRSPIKVSENEKQVILNDYEIISRITEEEIDRDYDKYEDD